MEAHELEPAVHERIEVLAREGDALASAGDYEGAILIYQNALSLLPTPKSEWEAYDWLWAAIGDSLFLTDDYRSALEAFRKVEANCAPQVSAFIFLRIGQCAMRLGDEKSALDNLMRAYLAEGEEIFDDEYEYLQFLSARVDLKGPPKL